MALDGDEDDDDDSRALRSAKNQGGTFHIKQKQNKKQMGRGGMIEASIRHSSFSVRGRGLTTEQRNAIQFQSGHNTDDSTAQGLTIN